MAHIWIEIEEQWCEVPLKGQPVGLDAVLRAGDQEGAAESGEQTECAGQVIFLRSDKPDPEVPSDWSVVHGPHQFLTVNGLPSPLGIVCLRDRDEVRNLEAPGSTGGRSVFFSTESLATVAPFPGSKRATFCARCRQKVQEEDVVVKCPLCSAWHHQSESLPCWTYSENCARGCGQSTDMTSGYNWSPEEIAR